MKWPLIIIILFSWQVFANEGQTEGHGANHENKHEAKKSDKRSASAEAYLKAKKSCLLENKELKGKDLKDCIVKKQSEAK